MIFSSPLISTFKLTKIFRQAVRASHIIKYAYQIKKGEIPHITSPVIKKYAFRNGIDCLFLVSDDANKDQIKFISKTKLNLKKEKMDFEIEEQDILEISFIQGSPEQIISPSKDWTRRKDKQHSMIFL